MSLALRFVKNYIIWDQSLSDYDWLNSDEIPADPLGDLQTKKNTLSIYIIGDDNSKLERCISAYAANRNDIEEISFVLFDENVIKNIGIKYKQNNNGLLLDEFINSLHYDLYELSSQKLIELTNNIYGKCFCDIKDRVQVTQLIYTSIENKWINESQLNRGIKKQLAIN
jgi:hypothetical protein